MVNVNCLAKKTGIPYPTLYTKIYYHHMTPDEAVASYRDFHNRRIYRGKALDHDISERAFRARVYNGWSYEMASTIPVSDGSRRAGEAAINAKD